VGYLSFQYQQRRIKKLIRFCNTVLDKLEHKFGGQRFNDPANDAKNRALNQKIAKRIMTIAPKVL
jgi:hypothetical protein